MNIVRPSFHEVLLVGDKQNKLGFVLVLYIGFYHQRYRHQNASHLLHHDGDLPKYYRDSLQLIGLPVRAFDLSMYHEFTKM